LWTGEEGGKEKEGRTRPTSGKREGLSENLLMGQLNNNNGGLNDLIRGEAGRKKLKEPVEYKRKAGIASPKKGKAITCPLCGTKDLIDWTPPKREKVKSSRGMEKGGGKKRGFRSR